MIRMIPLFLWITIALSSFGCSSSAAKIDVGKLLTSGRDGWQHPHSVLASLEISPGDTVAEIGAGSGYWIGHLSKAVGPDGRVYAVEVEQSLFDELEELVKQEAYGNVEVISVAYHDPKLHDETRHLTITLLSYYHI